MISEVKTYRMECNHCHSTRVVIDEYPWRTNEDILRANGWHRFRLEELDSDMWRTFDCCQVCYEYVSKSISEGNTKVREERKSR